MLISSLSFCTLHSLLYYDSHRLSTLFHWNRSYFSSTILWCCLFIHQSSIVFAIVCVSMCALYMSWWEENHPPYPQWIFLFLFSLPIPPDMSRRRKTMSLNINIGQRKGFDSNVSWFCFSSLSSFPEPNTHTHTQVSLVETSKWSCNWIWTLCMQQGLHR